MESIPKEPEFNLRSTIRAILADSDEADPGVIADLAFEVIDPDDMAAALRQSLRQFVRQIITEQRAHASVPPKVHPHARSWKVQGIREQWTRALAQRVFTGGGWKLLRDCTRDDLLFAASERRENAARSIAVAEQYESFAEQLKRRKVMTVGELPADAQSAILGLAS